MSYLSPLHIIRELAGDGDFRTDPEGLLRLRKRLLAELNLEGGATLMIGGRSYSKDSIIKTIDQLMDSESLALHDFIYRHPALLHYLEHEREAGDTGRLSELSIPEKLHGALDPLLSARILLQFKKGIGSRNFELSRQALPLMDLLEGHFRIACYEEVHRSLMAFLHFLLELKRRIDSHSGETLSSLEQASLAFLLNSLPPDFSELKRSLVNVLINILILYHSFSGHDHALVIRISDMLLQVSCEEEQALMIRYNHGLFALPNTSASPEDVRFTAKTETAPKTNLDFRAFVVLLICLALTVFVMSNSRTDDGSQTDPVPTFAIPDLLPGAQSSVTGINRLREEVITYTSDKQPHFSYWMDPVEAADGRSPFRDASFDGSDSSRAGWKKPLTISNHSGYELILCRFDPGGRNLEATYIGNGKTCKLSTGSGTRLVFYFGRRLRMLHMPSFDSFHERELFAENHSNTVALLCKDYIIALRSPADSLSPADLDISPSFLKQPKNELSFKNFALAVVSDARPLTSAAILPEKPEGKRLACLVQKPGGNGKARTEPTLTTTR